MVDNADALYPSCDAEGAIWGQSYKRAAHWFVCAVYINILLTINGIAISKPLSHYACVTVCFTIKEKALFASEGGLGI